MASLLRSSVLVALVSLIGRRRQLEQLEHALERAADGAGELVLVTGEPGMGKSRLVEEFVERRRSVGSSVWMGQCWEAGGAPPYWPWTQALRALVRHVGQSRVQDRLGARVVFLRTLLPELPYPHSSEVSVEDPDQARFQVFDAVGELLTEAADDGPVCLALEDLHASDEASLLLLEFVARATPTLIIGTYRERESWRRPIGSTLARVARRGTVVPLEPLSAADVARYLEQVWGQPPSPEIVEALWRSSEGNPLFVSELQRRSKGQPGTESPMSVETLGVPPGIEAAISEHLHELDPEVMEVVEAAAVLGRQFDAGMLAQLTGLDDDSVLGQLGRAQQVGLLERAASGGYRFAHYMHRAVLYQNIDPVRRSAMHLRVTELLRQGVDSDLLPWSTLAHHYFAAGHPVRDQAIEAASEAARVAVGRRAFADAAVFLGQALELLDAGAAIDRDRRLDLLLRLAQSQLDAGEVEAGRRTCEQTIELARACGAVCVLAKAALAYGSVFELGVVNTRLVGLLEETLEALGEREPGLRAQVLARYAAARQPAFDPTEPIEIAREAIALARKTGNARELLGTIRSAISAMMDVGDPHERIDLNREYVALALRGSEPTEVMRGYLRMSVDALELGDKTTVDRSLDALTRIADEMALPHFQWLAYGFHAVRSMIEGRVNTAERWADQMRVFAARTGEPHVPITTEAYRLGVLRIKREDDQLLARLDEIGPEALGPTWGRPFLAVLRASTLARLGRTKEAQLRLSSNLVDTVVSSRDPMSLCCLAEVVAFGDDVELARRMLDALQPRRNRCVSWGVLCMSWDGPVERVLGLLEARLDRREDAVRSFAAAAATCREMDAVLHLRQVEDDRARVFDGGSPRAQLVEVDAHTMLRPRLQSEGETWMLRAGTEKLVFTNTRGMGMLARMLDEPGREFHVLDLSGSPAAATSDAGVLLDERARQAYRRRAEHLRSELAEAETFNDPVRVERARAELEALSRELAAAVGLGGRSRKAGSNVERARVNVQRRIKDAIRRIREQDEVVGRHLARSVRTGTYCAYEPD